MQPNIVSIFVMLGSLRRRLRASLPAALGLGLGLAACYPGRVTSTSDTDVVATVHDSTVSFDVIKTYALVDSVVHLELGEGEQVPVSRADDDAIIFEVESQMNARGYVRELDPETNGADVVLLLGADAQRNTTWYVSRPWWPFWGWYPGWGFWPSYGPGWGWRWPGQVRSVQYDEGSLFIVMVDVRDPAAQAQTQEAPVIWAAALNGILSRSSGVNTVRVLNGIKRAFTQSTYIRRGS